jgi:hypothetical protein
MSPIKEPLRLKITSSSGTGKPIPLSVIANSFQKVQALVYILGDQNEGNEYRMTGVYPNLVKERYELALSHLDIGSADTYITPVFSVQALEGFLSPAEQVISQMIRIIEVISTSDDAEPTVYEILPDERRRKRFIRELSDFWPDEQTAYTFEIAHAQSPLTPLAPERHQILSRLFRTYHPVHELKDSYGRIISLHVDEKRKIIIETPDGEVVGHYSAEIEDVLRQHLGCFIHFEAIMRLDKGRYFVEIDDSITIEQIGTYPLDYVIIEGRKKPLKTNLSFSLTYTDEQYHLENQELLIETFATRFKDAIVQVMDQLELLYLEYCTCDISELTPDAIDLRNMLLSYIEG